MGDVGAVVVVVAVGVVGAVTCVKTDVDPITVGLQLTAFANSASAFFNNACAFIITTPSFCPHGLQQTFPQ